MMLPMCNKIELITAIKRLIIVDEMSLCELFE